VYRCLLISCSCWSSAEWSKAASAAFSNWHHLAGPCSLPANRKRQGRALDIHPWGRPVTMCFPYPGLGLHTRHSRRWKGLLCPGQGGGARLCSWLRVINEWDKQREWLPSWLWLCSLCVPSYSHLCYRACSRQKEAEEIGPVEASSGSSQSVALCPASDA
jgi:hypothetical protein